MIQSLLFRDATASDYGEICNLVRNPLELFLVHPRGRFPWTIDQIERLARAREALTVAEVEGEIAGFANLYDRTPTHVFIGNVIVRQEWRGQGLGRALVGHMVERARSFAGLEEIRISVFAGNTPALLLYSRFGFVPFGMEERIDPSGARIPLLHLRLSDRGQKTD